MPSYYTGVGSRKTPTAILALMQDLAAALAAHGYVLRSGGADGADTAFEQGARRVPGVEPHIYLPWRGFNANPSSRFTVPAEAFLLARGVHPAWDRLSDAVRKLHARNACQVLGDGLDEPSAFLACWTADGCESSTKRSATTGGTATAIVLAESRGIPVFNLSLDASIARLNDWLAAHRIAHAWPRAGIAQAALF